MDPTTDIGWLVFTSLTAGALWVVLDAAIGALATAAGRAARARRLVCPAVAALGAALLAWAACAGCI